MKCCRGSDNFSVRRHRRPVSDGRLSPIIAQEAVSAFNLAYRSRKKVEFYSRGVLFDLITLFTALRSVSG